jgi:hypothetical protein
MDAPVEARLAVRARVRKELDELEYRRALLKLSRDGHTQREISGWLGITQPSVQSALQTAQKVPLPVEGFSGANPIEICQRFAAELIGREQLVDELTRFPYADRTPTDGYDWLAVQPTATWSEVSRAVRMGLIDDDVYEEVFARRHGSSAAAS